MHTHLKTIAVALLGTLISTSALAASTTLDNTEYTVTYDDATPFGAISFWGGGGGGLFFGWTSPAPSAYGAYTTGDGNPASLSFPALSFILQAKLGYLLSDFKSTIGGAYAAFVGGTVSASAPGIVAFDGGASTPIAHTYTSDPTPVGLWNLTYQTSVPVYTRADFSVDYSLQASGPQGSFAGIFAHPNTGPKFEFQVSAVPEPETWAMLLVGVGLVGWRLQSCAHKDNRNRLA
jgi:hypothetical protein